MKTFFLITNTNGYTYWSYLGHRDNTVGTDFVATKDYGIIFINKNGGYFTSDNIHTVHQVVIQDEFPAENI